MFEAFQLGPFLFRSHLLFLLLGLWLATELFLRLAASEELDLLHFLEHPLLYLLAFILGGRLFAVLVLYRIYLQDPSRILIFWDGTFSLLGGCIGLGLALSFLIGQRQATFLQWLDAFLPAVTLGLMFDWLGRFFGALSYGRPTNIPWGIVLESMSVRYVVPVHPVQLYYALFYLLLTLLLLVVRKKQRRTGLVTLLGIVGSALGTILLEFLRGDFALTVFAKLSDFFFLGGLFVSLGLIAVLGRRLSPRYSIVNSLLIAIGTMGYLLVRPWIDIASIEWRFSQFLAVLAILSTVVYVVVHRWKYPNL
jgi:prolipoprotein diacylglyceryl transferase